MSTDKKLYVVVHHQQDRNQNWINRWLDDERLETITTTAEIGELCSDMMARGKPVLVHRCGYGELPPSVCCAANVIQSTAIDRRTSLVTFAAHEVLLLAPPIAPYRGQNYYWA